MADVKHSAGPWKVGYMASDVWAEDHKGPFKVCDIRGWGHLTGKGHGALGLPDDAAVAIQKANACLIAAAPEMLEALIELRRWKAFSHPDAAYAFNRADAAIAKAAHRSKQEDAA